MRKGWRVYHKKKRKYVRGIGNFDTREAAQDWITRLLNKKRDWATKYLRANLVVVPNGQGRKLYG